MRLFELEDISNIVHPIYMDLFTKFHSTNPFIISAIKPFLQSTTIRPQNMISIINNLLKALNFTSPPRQVSPGNFKTMKDSGNYTDCWRGVRKSTFVDQFKYSNHHFPGDPSMKIIGVWADSGPNGYATAYNFAGGYPENIINFLYPDSAKIIGDSELQTLISDTFRIIDRRFYALENPDTNIINQHDLLTRLIFQPTFTALLHGYDACETFTGYLVVFNRSKIIISK